MNEHIGNDLCVDIITQAINEMKEAQGDSFSLENINLAELERRTGISRSRLRRLKQNGFVIKPHGRTGMKSDGGTIQPLCNQRKRASAPTISPVNTLNLG